MAEVEKVTTSTVAATTAADIPVTSIGGGSGADAVSGAVELGTSPTQERSSNSHPHDSEYDTASDLEGGEDYDDDEDDDLEHDLDHDDDSMTDGESMTDYDDEDVENDGPVAVGGGAQEKVVDAEAQKKVDEDRSNPQYIPKRGTFYEHDDRTAEGEVDGVAAAGDGSEAQDGSINGAKSPQSPDVTSSQQASKTMKKWQQASGVERWSHDRFDASEQAPKSRSELVNSYGYDIRTEDAPPRARRRRRYGRGPSKYSRNWEDENAYLKASNKDRKPPRPSDFPALNERAGVVKDRKKRITRDEKENRVERRQMADVGVNAAEKPTGIGGPRSGPPLDDRSRDGKIGDNKNKSYGRQNAPVGRQAAMEFKQKQRSGQMNQAASSNSNSQNNRNDYQRQSNRPQNSHFSNEQQQLKSSSGKGQSSSHQRQPYQNDSYNHNSNGKVQDLTYQQQMQSPQQQHQPQTPMSMRQPQQPQPKTTPTSNLSQRLQQVQNRNDPSHVGSVQMHALATQNQMVGQQQQQAASLLLSPQQQAQQIPPQEQRGPPKRYSSLRRSQHEAQHITEQHQHQLQQLHLQQQQQQPLILQDQQHIIQANLMQLYHQENLQAQMQALQVNQSPGQPKQSAYGAVPPAAQPQPQPYGATPVTTAAPAYYVAAPDAYVPTAAANAQAPPAAQYAAQQPPPNYLPSPQTAVAAAAATLAYSGPPAPAAPQAVVAGAGAAAPYGPTSAVPAAVTAASAVPQTATNANPNYTNYQNYNTVGGTTYFVPPAQATTRPVVLPQRRPTNAIPILPPSEKSKQRAIDNKDEKNNSGSISGTLQSAAPLGSAENIDHILDNMFVQRPAFQPTVPPSRKSSSPSNTEHNANNTSGNGGSGGDNNSSPTAQQTDDTASSAHAPINASITTNSTDKMSNSIDGIGVAVENINTNNAVTAQE